MSHFGRAGPPDIRDTYSLLVLNITFRTSADDLYPLFDRYGKVVDIFIPRDRRTGESRGFAFVRYKYADEAQKAIERLDGRNVDGRDMVVQYAKYGREMETIQRGRITETTVKKVSRSRSRSPRRPSRDRRHTREDERYPRDTRRRSRSRDRYERERYRDERGRGGGDRERERGRSSRRRSPSRSVSRSRSRSRGRASGDVKRPSRSVSDRPKASPHTSRSPSRGHSPRRKQSASPPRKRSVSQSPSRSMSRSPAKRFDSEEPMKEVVARNGDSSPLDPVRDSESPEEKSSPPRRQISSSPGARSHSPPQRSISPEHPRRSPTPDQARSPSSVHSDGP